VSFLRLAAVPYFWFVLVVQERIGLAAVLVFLIGGTDWIDGWLARKLGQESKLGAFLDPLADRLMIASALVGGWWAGALPVVFALPLILRELAVSVGAAVLAARGGGTLQVRYVGKLATFLLYGAIPSFYLSHAEIAWWLFTPAAWIAGALGLFLYWWVATGYASDIRRVLT
jgi:cardiolipin synthase (CMP-forming)